MEFIFYRLEKLDPKISATLFVHTDGNSVTAVSKVEQQESRRGDGQRKANA